MEYRVFQDIPVRGAFLVRTDAMDLRVNQVTGVDNQVTRVNQGYRVWTGRKVTRVTRQGAAKVSKVKREILGEMVLRVHQVLQEGPGRLE